MSFTGVGDGSGRVPCVLRANSGVNAGAWTNSMMTLYNIDMISSWRGGRFGFFGNSFTSWVHTHRELLIKAVHPDLRNMRWPEQSECVCSGRACRLVCAYLRPSWLGIIIIGGARWRSVDRPAVEDLQNTSGSHNGTACKREQRQSSKCRALQDSSSPSWQQAIQPP